MNSTKSNKEALEAVIERIKDGCMMEVMSQAACTCVINMWPQPQPYLNIKCLLEISYSLFVLKSTLC